MVGNYLRLETTYHEVLYLFIYLRTCIHLLLQPSDRLDIPFSLFFLAILIYTYHQLYYGPIAISFTQYLLLGLHLPHYYGVKALVLDDVLEEDDEHVVVLIFVVVDDEVGDHHVPTHPVSLFIVFVGNYTV